MPDLTCREFVRFLDDYIDGTQPTEVRAEFERHLAICPPCVDYLKTYRDTISLARAACAEDPSLPAPGDVPEELIQIILSSRPTRRSSPSQKDSAADSGS